MNRPLQTRTFKSGNSVALRLPKELAIPAGADVEIERSGDTLTIRLARDPAEVKRQLRQLYEDLVAIGRPGDGVQARPDFEAPVRKGL